MNHFDTNKDLINLTILSFSFFQIRYNCILIFLIILVVLVLQNVIVSSFLSSGQVTIKIEMKALRIVAPERDSDGDMIDTSMLASPQKHLGTPHRLHHQSYENMLMLDSPDESGDRSIRIMDYPYDDEEYEKPCKRSFFCFCFPRTAKKKKVKEKKYQEQKDRTNTKSSAKEKEDLPREQNGAKSSKGVRVKSHERGRQSQAACNWSKGDAVEVTLSGDSRRNSGSPRRDFSVDLKNSINDKKSNPAAGTRQENKENTDPIIMEYNKKMELIRLRAQRSKHKNEGKSDSSSVIMCEKWKSNGRHFQKKLAAFCQQFDYDLQTYVIKYFEQDRGTLVLHVWTDGCAMYINNICLTVDQVKHLQRDLASSALRDRLDALLRSNGSLDKLDIKDIDIEVVIGDEQFKQAFQDLS